MMTFNVRGLGHPIKREKSSYIFEKRKKLLLHPAGNLPQNTQESLDRKGLFFKLYKQEKRNSHSQKSPFYKNNPGRHVLYLRSTLWPDLTLPNIYEPNEDCPKFITGMLPSESDIGMFFIKTSFAFNL